MTVVEFSQIIDKSPVNVIKELIRQGQMLSMNDPLSLDLAVKIAVQFGVPVKKSAEEVKPTRQQQNEEQAKDPSAVAKCPVVTVMGHVDHGKTTLLDVIRGTSAAAKEVGGITQSIGAYQVSHNGSPITFIDTPGHAAFTAIRSNGVQVTDIVLLVIAADDGIKPQTLEAIDHAKAAGAILIVAVTKIDLPNISVETIKFDLSKHDILVEELGGDVIVANVSAKTEEGISDLLDTILLVAEVNELKANPNAEVAGLVVEAYKDRFKGMLVTPILNAGTLKRSDVVIIGSQYGKVRSMTDENGKILKEIGPGKPAQLVVSSDELPFPGDKLEVAESESVAKNLIKARRNADLRKNAGRMTTVEDIRQSMKQQQRGDKDKFNVIIKTATQGELSVLCKSLEQELASDKEVKLVSTGVGQINESDILLASAAEAIVIGFNVKIDKGAERQISVTSTPTRVYNIIYRFIEDAQDGFTDLLGTKSSEVMVGLAEVLQTFSYGKNNKVAGIRMVQGYAGKNARIRITRDEEEIYNGSLSSMRHLKNAVDRLDNQQEGGLIFKDFKQFEIGDKVGFFEVQQNK